MIDPAALSLFEIAQKLIGIAIDISTDNHDEKNERLERVQAQLDTACSRLGIQSLEEHATRNATTVSLSIVKQQATRSAELCKTMDDIATIKMLERAITREISDWLASRRK